jgi:hypothetical protein
MARQFLSRTLNYTRVKKLELTTDFKVRVGGISYCVIYSVFINSASAEEGDVLAR